MQAHPRVLEWHSRILEELRQDQDDEEDDPFEGDYEGMDFDEYI